MKTEQTGPHRAPWTGLWGKRLLCVVFVAEYSHEDGASSTTSPHYVSSQEDSNRPKHLQLKGGEEKDLESNPSSPQHVKSHDSHKQGSRSHDASKRRRSHDAHMITKQERERREYSLRQHHLHVSSAHHHSTNTLSSPSNATMETGVEDRVRYQGEHRNVGTAGEELSTLSEKPGNIFELFRTHDGEEYTVYMREDGKRFYVDFEEQVREGGREGGEVHDQGMLTELISNASKYTQKY